MMRRARRFIYVLVDCCCLFSFLVHEFDLTPDLAQSFEEAEQHRSQFIGGVHLEQLAVLKEPVRSDADMVQRMCIPRVKASAHSHSILAPAVPCCFLLCRWMSRGCCRCPRLARHRRPPRSASCRTCSTWSSTTRRCRLLMLPPLQRQSKRKEPHPKHQTPLPPLLLAARIERRRTRSPNTQTIKRLAAACFNPVAI